MAAPSQTPSPSMVAPHSRRSVTDPSPQKVARQLAEPAVDKSASKTVFSHDNAKVISFVPPSKGHNASPTDSSRAPWPWKDTRERRECVGELSIYLSPNKSGQLKGRDWLLPLMPNSQWWCVDKQSSFASSRGRPERIYRVDLPYTSDEEKQKVVDFREALGNIVRLDDGPSPFLEVVPEETGADGKTPKRKRRLINDNGRNEIDHTWDSPWRRSSAKSVSGSLADDYADDSEDGITMELPDERVDDDHDSDGATFGIGSPEKEESETPKTRSPHVFLPPVTPENGGARKSDFTAASILLEDTGTSDPEILMTENKAPDATAGDSVVDAESPVVDGISTSNGESVSKVEDLDVETDATTSENGIITHGGEETLPPVADAPIVNGTSSSMIEAVNTPPIEIVPLAKDDTTTTAINPFEGLNDNPTTLEESTANPIEPEHRGLDENAAEVPKVNSALPETSSTQISLLDSSAPTDASAPPSVSSATQQSDPLLDVVESEEPELGRSAIHKMVDEQLENALRSSEARHATYELPSEDVKLRDSMHLAAKQTPSVTESNHESVEASSEKEGGVTHSEITRPSPRSQSKDSDQQPRRLRKSRRSSREILDDDSDVPKLGIFSLALGLLMGPPSGLFMAIRDIAQQIGTYGQALVGLSSEDSSDATSAGSFWSPSFLLPGRWLEENEDDLDGSDDDLDAEDDYGVPLKNNSANAHSKRHGGLSTALSTEGLTKRKNTTS